MNQLVVRLICILSMSIVCGVANAQSLAQAKVFYTNGEYDKAKPAFARLVRLSPGNSSYNHWYGVCCLKTKDYVLAEKHLKMANKRRVQESYRFLADLYIKTYRFEEAIPLYQGYIKLLERKKQDTNEWSMKIRQAEDAQRMMEKVEDVVIIDSVQLPKAQFLQAYSLSEESGKLQSYDSFFKTSKAHSSTVYSNQKGDKLFFAHPDEEGVYKLYTQSQLFDSWEEEKPLSDIINKKQDTNYPFVLSDGVTMYFASKGNGSIGGYDLFVTRYNMNTDEYLAPEQLSMPFNSPDNDYMMVIDERKNLGWFVTDRRQPQDTVCVYLFRKEANNPRVQSEDITLKRSRSQILSIKDSWEAAADYTSLVSLAHQQILFGEKKIRKDFVFVVDDSRTYHVLDQIKNKDARAYYEKFLALNRQIEELKQQISNMRHTYSQEKAKREELTPLILSAEKQLEDLLGTPEEWEKKARNAEINATRSH